jgi:hypothetical protein
MSLGAGLLFNPYPGLQCVVVGISQHHECRRCHDAAVSMAAAAAPAAPVWPLLAVAGITVAGTLGATVLTLLWSARREDRRWQRERQNRHEQDSRAEEYARLVAALHAWYTALTSARAGRLNAGLLGKEPDTSDVRRQRAATREVVAMVDFMAPPNVREPAWRAVRDGEMYYVQVTAPPPASEDHIEAAAKRFRQSRTALSDAMREDLGLQPGAEIAEPPKRRRSLPWRRG